MTKTITASVGLKGANRHNDVKVVQLLLNNVPPKSGGPDPKLDVDGFIGPLTVGAIKKFQKHHFGWADGRVDPNQMTIKKLNEFEEKVESHFSIDVRFLGGLTAGQRDVFETAAARWSEIIIGDLPSVKIDSEVIDDVLIEARGISIDGPRGVLGRAGPIRLRNGSLLPATGIMEFDIGDLHRMEADGSLINVIIHEMGHVLGIGTLWNLKGLLIGAGTANPIFTGANGMREFSSLRRMTFPLPVPVANTGGEGTRDGHWREAVFGNELMTGFLDEGVNSLSRMTIASLEDLGYAVNYKTADPFILPSALQLAVMGIGAEGGYGNRQCSMCGTRTQGLGPVILPKSATV